MPLFTNIFFFSQKYPAFVEFYCDEIFGATCALCKEKPGKSKLAMTNPSGHFLCLSCSCNQVRVWKEEGRDRRKCPVCRTILLDHMFATPISQSSTKLHETSLYVWVPTSLYIHENHNQSFVSSLTRKDFDAAFRSAFLTLYLLQFIMHLHLSGRNFTMIKSLIYAVDSAS